MRVDGAVLGGGAVGWDGEWDVIERSKVAGGENGGRGDVWGAECAVRG